MSALIDELHGIRPLSSNVSTPSPVSEQLKELAHEAGKRREKVRRLYTICFTLFHGFTSNFTTAKKIEQLFLLGVVLFGCSRGIHESGKGYS